MYGVWCMGKPSVHVRDLAWLRCTAALDMRAPQLQSLASFLPPLPAGIVMASNSNNQRRRRKAGCSSRVKITVVGSRQSETIVRKGVSEEQSQLERKAAAAAYVGDLRSACNM